MASAAASRKYKARSSAEGKGDRHGKCIRWRYGARPRVPWEVESWTEPVPVHAATAREVLRYLPTHPGGVRGLLESVRKHISYPKCYHMWRDGSSGTDAVSPLGEALRRLEHSPSDKDGRRKRGRRSSSLGGGGPKGLMGWMGRRRQSAACPAVRQHETDGGSPSCGREDSRAMPREVSACEHGRRPLLVPYPYPFAFVGPLHRV